MVKDSGDKNGYGPGTSDGKRRVLDALLEGMPPPPDAQAALTETERAEIAALARTAHLTRLTLRKPDPAPDAEAEALRRAQAAFAARAASGGLRSPLTGPADTSAPSTRPFWQTWWERVSHTAPKDGDE